MGKKFKQRQRTVHIAVELLDRVLLDPRAADNADIQSMSDHIVSVYVCTCFLIASKYDEIDDRLVFIDDISAYLRTTKYKTCIPTYTDIVETERHILKFFGWDIGFTLPLHFLEMFLAQGVVFRDDIGGSQEAAGEVAKRAYRFLDQMVQRRDSFKNHGALPSEIAALCLFKARKEVLSSDNWPVQIQFITRVSNSQMCKIHQDYR